MNLYFEELGHRNLTAKIGSLLYLIVLSQRSAKKFAHNSISACEFCKHQRKFACFRTFGNKLASIIIKTLKSRKFGTYLLTLLHSEGIYGGGGEGGAEKLGGKIWDILTHLITQ